ncbi:ABC transporter ATP-binding protein [Blastopirellula marina]|uniref:ABC transporter ATP-binding protein n=1 Tax=Blastopirellula marina TaxID=124 RepID=A0A2S8FHF2_9BACT|nr:ABC transporter ATP-binding protein [Blastopirellula marina]PQO31621.1 ABC transporter ATP-binding protein [Blastopirellula marina]PTL42928.1 ABC transporter ATP-binding protein [Blastopirellula marina]
MTKILLKVDELRTFFHGEEVVKAVDGISFKLAEGETLGIVGESGSGKSVTSLSIMQLLARSAKIESGTISFLGTDLVRLPDPAMRKIRGKDISMIFQEPMTSLNPVFTVGSQVMEAIMLHQRVSKAAAREQTIQLFDEVGIPEPHKRVHYYPHQMSGGQKQRVMIAMALSCNPKLLIADEPTTALDVTIQAQILDILRRLRDSRGMSILFITHDLGVIAEIADHVLVMYRGKVVEHGEIHQIFESPQHPYTKGLLACRPRLDTKVRRLPTVSDFMDSKVTDSGIEITEKQMSPEKYDELLQAGRGRLLHPKPILQEIGHPWRDGVYSSDTKCVPDDEKPLLSVRNLKVHFPIRKGIFSRVHGHVKAVDGIDFDVFRGQTLGLVGESGCGKTTTGRAILRLIEPTDGVVEFEGKDVRSLRGAALREMRKKLQIIFQDPYGSLNPRMTIEAAICEPMVIQGIGGTRKDQGQRAADLMQEVGMNPDHLRRYPHEFSGGQRQRICIARALAVEPDFLVCDESVSALDVSVQAQVLNLLKELQERRGLTYIFISHDLSVVKFMADMMAVMNAGKIVEFGPAEDIYANPAEEYTRKLINATPKDSLEHIQMRQEERKQARAERLSTIASV